MCVCVSPQVDSSGICWLMIALNFTEQSKHVHPAGSRLNSRGLKARRWGWWSSRRRCGRPAEARRIFAWRGIKHSLDIWTQESSADISKVQEDHPGRGGGQRSGPAQRNSHVHMVAKNTTVTKTLPSYSWNRCFSYHVVQVYCVLNLLECVCVSSHSPHLVEIEPPQHEDEGRDEQQANGCNTCWKVMEKNKSLTKITLIFHLQLSFQFLKVNNQSWTRFITKLAWG